MPAPDAPFRQCVSGTCETADFVVVATVFVDGIAQRNCLFRHSSETTLQVQSCGK